MTEQQRAGSVAVAKGAVRARDAVPYGRWKSPMGGLRAVRVAAARNPG